MLYEVITNKLYTIAGLIQIGAHQEALELVMTEVSRITSYNVCYTKLLRFPSNK